MKNRKVWKRWNKVEKGVKMETKKKKIKMKIRLNH